MTAEKQIQNNSDGKDELYLLDGSGFIFRAYYAIAYGQGASLTNPEGVPVGAVLGFTNMLLKLLNDYHAPYLAVVFDSARETFRNEIYANYKANRDEPPEDLIPQFPLVREATKAFNIPCLELEGYEADDLIATYTKLARAQGKKVVIVSSDKDLMQLVGDGVRMLDPMKQKWIGPDEVMEKFGVGPERVVDVQALAGDSIDNVPGVPGIGIKTAAQLINEFGDLETLLERAAEIKQNKRRESIIEHAENARISKKLVQLDADAPPPIALEDMETNDVSDDVDLIAFLQKQGFKSTLKRLGQPADVIPSASEGSGLNASDSSASPQNDKESWPPISENTYTLINDEDTLKQWVAEAYEKGILVIDTETTALTPAKADLVGICLASKIGKAAYIPVGHVSNSAQATDLFDQPDESKEQDEDIKQLSKDKVIEILKPVLEDPCVIKIGHNMKYDWQIMAMQGVHMTPVDDTMLMSYVLDGTEHSHGMDKLSELLLGHSPIKYEEVAGKGKNQITFDQVAIKDALNYAAEDADITLRFYHTLKPRIAAERMAFVYENIERPLITVIAQMELEGIKVDPAILKKMSQDFAVKIDSLEKEIHKMAGTEFNIASPKQVGEILFDQMGLQGGKKTSSGAYSTSVDVLEKLAAEGHEIVQKILEHRQVSKLRSTYTEALQNEINPRTGRVHTSFSMAHVNTGRLSSSDPNLQNIPIRTEEGRKIREAFVPIEDCTLLSVDYSQVELRLAAEIADIKLLKQAFVDGVDIHTLTASQVFDVPLDEVSGELRRSAKAVNFGIIYGISGWGLAKQLGCEVSEASEFISKYLSRFPELQDYMQETKEEAKRQGFVKTLYGRKCVIAGAMEKNPARKGFAERAAINAPLQGTAADIMKMAMARMPGALKDAGLNAKMLLQVHDELIFEVPNEELEKTSELVRNVMEGIADTDVPLIAKAGSGSSWAQAH